MKAAVFSRYGGGEVVEVGDVPVPVPGRDEVLVRVRAASVNPLDWKVRSGQARLLTGSRFPKVLGSECAGEVVQTGAGAAMFRSGDRVVLYASVRRLGAFAEYACASAGRVFPVPAGISFEQAACLPIAGLTALQALRDHGRIKRGMQVLINGAAGGVGHFAVQIARVFGADVTGVCSGRNVEFVRSLGAQRVLDRGNEDFTRGRARYDLIFDAVAASSFWSCRAVLGPAGVYVSTLPNATVLAQVLTAFLPGRKARQMWVRPNAADMVWMMERLTEGTVRVTIDAVYPLDRVREAVAASEGGGTRGKIVLAV